MVSIQNSNGLKLNFGVEMDYFVLIQFDGLKSVVDAMDGVDVDIPRPMSGYNAGTHLMNGDQALAFVRDRAGSDDFFRMERGQIFIKSLLTIGYNRRGLLKPTSWGKLPAVTAAVSEMVETDVPVFLFPRLGLALLRAGPDGIDSRVIIRDYVNPFTTPGGAQVLGPDWETINPVVEELFDVEREEQ
ncbi:MAG: LCP family protein [Anaerolineales bacterium]